MPTKEEIALKETSVIFNEYELGITGLANAMEIYAKQECINFAYFLNKTPKGIILKNSYVGLYELYLQSKEKVNAK